MLLLALILAAHYWALYPFLVGITDDWDARHLYLPLARDLLDKGAAFLADERSLQAPLFSYAYPALYGADLDRVKLGNALLSGGTLLLVFRSAFLLHSRLAGLLAAGLFAASPLLRPYLAAPLTEGPFVFLAALWFWGMAEWVVHRRNAALVLSATGLCLAELTRAPIFYWNVLLVAVLTGLWLRGPKESRPALRPLALAYAAALVIPVVLIVKNMALFGFAFYATGGGNALYLGSNPLTGGYDPLYLGLGYDVGAIARGQSHLTLEAERLLGGAAKLIFADKGLLFVAANDLRKLVAFVFVTNAQPDALWLRSWRIVLVVLGAAGVLATRHAGLRWAFLGVAATLVALHAPVLYVHRYSVGALDLWLVIAAGIGLASAAAHGRRAIALALAALVGLGIGAWVHAYAGKPMPDVFAVPRLLVWRHPAPLALPAEAEVALPVSGTQWFRWWNNHVLVLDVHADPMESRCSLEVSYARTDGQVSDRVAILLGGGARRYQVGGAALNLDREGIVRLKARCATGVRLEGAAIYAALGPIDYHARLTGTPPALPIER